MCLELLGCWVEGCITSLDVSELLSKVVAEMHTLPARCKISCLCRSHQYLVLSDFKNDCLYDRFEMTSVDLICISDYSVG